VTVAVIQMTQVAAALGFGLFAILSIIRLRSEPFNNRELAYFIGALVLGLVNGIGTGALWFTVLLNVVLLSSMFLLDHPLLLQSDLRRQVVLDRVIIDDIELRAALAALLRADITDVAVSAIDLVKDSMVIDVSFRSAILASHRDGVIA
jgi:Domain of unknown function (DUF4956)